MRGATAGTMVLELFLQEASLTVSFVFLGQRSLLRWLHLPARDSGLHGPRRGSHRHKAG